MALRLDHANSASKLLAAVDQVTRYLTPSVLRLAIAGEEACLSWKGLKCLIALLHCGSPQICRRPGCWKFPFFFLRTQSFSLWTVPISRRHYGSKCLLHQNDVVRSIALWLEDVARMYIVSRIESFTIKPRCAVLPREIVADASIAVSLVCKVTIKP